MTHSKIFYDILMKRVKISKSVNFAEEYDELVESFFQTIDWINHVDRDTEVIPNGNPIKDFQILSDLKSLIWPKSIGMVASRKASNYINYDVYYSKAAKDAKPLTLAQFKEAQERFFDVMKITLNDSDFTAVGERTEQVFNVIDEGCYSFNNQTKCESSLYPIPLTISCYEPKYYKIDLDDEYVSEWYRDNLFNKFNVRVSSKA